MIIRIPAVNNIGVCQECWSTSTPHNERGLLAAPYLRVPYCSRHDVPGDRIQSPMLRDDRFLVDDVLFVVTDARIEPDSDPQNAPVVGHAWVWVVEAVEACS